jgi:hypothetical protein
MQTNAMPLSLMSLLQPSPIQELWQTHCTACLNEIAAKIKACCQAMFDARPHANISKEARAKATLYAEYVKGREEGILALDARTAPVFANMCLAVSGDLESGSAFWKYRDMWPMGCFKHSLVRAATYDVIEKFIAQVDEAESKAFGSKTIIDLFSTR